MSPVDGFMLMSFLVQVVFVQRQQRLLIMSSVSAQDEMEYSLREEQPRRGWRVGVAAGVAGLAVLGVVAWTNGVSPMSAQVDGIQGKEERLDVIPSYPACSKASENCFSTGCCQTSGHKCFTQSYGKAHCNETCTKGTCG